MLPVLLIFTALFIDLSAGRWGAYIRTPIPGLYLPDALLFLGVLSVIPNWRYLFGLPKIVLATTGLTILYIMIRFAEAYWSGQFREAPYLVIRDLAPFGYLALVPAIAIALLNANFTWLLWTIRISTVIHLVGVTLVTVGLLSPVRVTIIEPSAVGFLEYRGDLQGVIFGVGFLAWGSWNGSARASRFVQFLVLTAAWQMQSRAALVTFLAVLCLSVLRERKGLALWKMTVLILGSLIVAALMSPLQDVRINPLQDVKTSSVKPNTYQTDILNDSGITKLVSPSSEGDGTANARLETYSQIWNYLPDEGFWLLGAGPGTDILYEICTGIKNAPVRTTIQQDGRVIYLPKCAVDSSEAATTLRDPHNWILNFMIHNGTVGLLVFVLALSVPIIVTRHVANSSLPMIAIFAYFVSGLFGVIISTPFAMLPIAVFLGWLVSLKQTSTVKPEFDQLAVS